MNQPLYNYSNDPRWGRIAPENSHFLAPNPFWHIVMSYLPKAPQLQDIRVAIETGTHTGWTAEIFAENMEYVFSIEKFAENNPYDPHINFKKLYDDLMTKHPNLEILIGDTSDHLQKIIKDNSEKTFLILIDAHCPTEMSPILKELQIIKKYSLKNDHVIIIDDGDDFGSSNYPTLDEIRQNLLDINPNYVIENTHVGRSTYIAY